MSAPQDSAIPVGAFPAPADATSILLFGGSFDPPHTGHFRLPSLARDAIGADWLIYIPAARSPFKSDGPIADADSRVAMLREGLAESGARRAGVATLELDRARTGAAPSYTIDTLREIQSRLDDRTKLRLLIGADQAREFHRWREARAIIEIAEPAVMLRAGDGAAQRELLDAMRDHWSAAEMKRWESWIIPLPQIEASSTEIRRIVREEGDRSERLKELTTPGVLSLIRHSGLYRS